MKKTLTLPKIEVYPYSGRCSNPCDVCGDDKSVGGISFFLSLGTAIHLLVHTCENHWNTKGILEAIANVFYKRITRPNEEYVVVVTAYAWRRLYVGEYGPWISAIKKVVTKEENLDIRAVGTTEEALAILRWGEIATLVFLSETMITEARRIKQFLQNTKVVILAEKPTTEELYEDGFLVRKLETTDLASIRQVLLK